MKRIDRATNYFRNQFNCSQSVFTAFGTDRGLSENDCLKIGCAFGAGMGRQQMTCGAVTGAIMAIGLLRGKGKDDPEEKKQETYALTRDFFKKFKELYGTVNCKELLEGLDLNNPSDYQTITDRNLFETKCERYVAEAVRITEKIIQ